MGSVKSYLCAVVVVLTLPLAVILLNGEFILSCDLAGYCPKTMRRFSLLRSDVVHQPNVLLV